MPVIWKIAVSITAQ